MNLLNVVNLYALKREPIPELLSMYYVSQILGIIEVLHRDGQVLHCDVKPDNFILTPGVIELEEEGEVTEELVQGAGVR
jgi:serine/threonine protein kinase